MLNNSSECWTVSLEMKRRTEPIDMWFYTKMLRTPCVEQVSNDNVLKKMSKNTSYLEKERELKLFGNHLEEMILAGFNTQRTGIQARSGHPSDLSNILVSMDVKLGGGLIKDKNY